MRTYTRYKVCPVRGRECIGERCAWWCEFADDCSVPLLAGMFADSEICRNEFPTDEGGDNSGDK